MIRLLLVIERAALGLGSVLLAATTAVYFAGWAQAKTAVADFESLALAPADQSDWSAKRIADYNRSLAKAAGDTLAVLRIPAVDVEVAVYDSSDPVALNRGAGLVEGTARPDAEGNIAIAGHRDGFFRGLKDISIGDEITLQTLAGTRRFEVTALDIVDPLDVSVLDPADDTIVTLITCYPFYYVGHAPERFIVRAALQ